MRRLSAPSRGERGSQRGGATLELVLIAPVLLSVMMLLVAFGRITSAQGYVDAAARDAARVAVAQRTATDAQEAANNSIDSAMQGVPASCASTATHQFDGTFQPSDAFEPSDINYLTVGVSCQVSMADLVFLPLAGDVELTSTFSSPMSSFYGVYEP